MSRNHHRSIIQHNPEYRQAPWLRENYIRNVCSSLVFDCQLFEHISNLSLYYCISRTQDGDCVYGVTCSQGSVQYFDGYYCFHTKTTIPPTTTTTSEPFTSGYDLSKICVQNGQVYRHGEIIERSVTSFKNDCFHEEITNPHQQIIRNTKV